MAEIVLTRATGYRTDRLRAYRVIIDDQRVGEIKPGETEVFSLSSGRHELQLKVDWASSEKLQVDLREDDQAKFVCAPRVKDDGVTMAIGLRMIYWLTVGFRNYIDIHPEGRKAPVIEPRNKLTSMKASTLFVVALAAGVGFWVATGEIIIVTAVLVAAGSLVLAGLVARVVSKIAIKITEKVQQRGEND